MTHLKRALGLAGAGVFACLATPLAAHAQSTSNDKLSFKLEGRVGGEYNSNVSIEDLDANTGEGDWAATINALAEVQLLPVDKLTLRAGYDFSQTIHEEFSAFDLTIQRPYAEIAYDFDLVTVGVLGNWATADLDGDEYLTYTQYQPYISKQFGNTLFLRGAYSSTEKDFTGVANDLRDATSDAYQFDSYFFLDGVQQYLIAGAKITEEDATGPEYDYSSATGRIRFVQRFDALGQEMTLRIGAEYEDRDYDNITPLIGAPRSDQRTVLDLSLDIPLGEKFFAETYYKYGNYSSNLQSANYDEHIAGVRLGVKM
jgi:hypothetical protein